MKTKNLRIFGLCTLALCIALTTSACATVVAVADVAASTVVYTAKTAVNVIDAVTPDIVNKD